MWSRISKKKSKSPSKQHPSVLRVSTTAKAPSVGLPAGAILLFGGLCLLMLGWGIWLLMTWMGELLFTENARFRVAKVEARSDGLLSESLLQSWTKVETGDNLFAVDIKQVRQQLETHPIVKQGVVQRKLPDTLSVVVYERVPIARMGQVEGGMNLLLDEEGIITNKSFTSKHLPLLRGVDVNVRLGDDISGGKAGPVLPYLVALRNMPGKIRDLLPVKDVIVGNPDMLVFRLKDNFDIYFPMEGNVEELLMEASRAIYDIHHKNLNLGNLDMRPTGPNKIGAPQ